MVLDVFFFLGGGGFVFLEYGLEREKYGWVVMSAVPYCEGKRGTRPVS